MVVVPDDQLSSLLEWLGQRSTTILKEISEEQEAAQPSQALYIDNEEAEDGPIPRLFTNLSDALNAGASDIHFDLRTNGSCSFSRRRSAKRSGSTACCSTRTAGFTY